MEDLWLKIKFWTKLSVIGLVTIYLVAFIAKNSDRQAQFWYWYKRDYAIPILVLASSSFLVGIIAALLVKTTFKTIRQLRKLRADARTQRMERDLADMKSKASMLQTKPTDSRDSESRPEEDT